MRAAVVGTGWGRVHISALQELGVDVVALCGTNLDQTSVVAHEHGIPQAFAGVDELPRLGLDLISIAAPTALHAELVAALGPTPLLCEKPAVGVEVPVAQLREPTGPVWVNYAFPFLNASREADEALGGRWPDSAGGIGPVVGVDIHSAYDLGALVSEERTPWQWLSDVASHPWSWAVARFGLPTGDPTERDVSAGWATLSYTSESGVPVSVSAQHQRRREGLRHTVRVRGTSGDLTFGGQFRLGHSWVFTPPRFTPHPAIGRPEAGGAAADAQGGAWADGHDGEWPLGQLGQPVGGDAWHRANVAAIAAVVHAVNSGPGAGRAGDDTSGSGDLSDLSAPAPRPFTWSQAVAMDACVQAASG